MGRRAQARRRRTALERAADRNTRHDTVAAHRAKFADRGGPFDKINQFGTFRRDRTVEGS